MKNKRGDVEFRYDNKLVIVKNVDYLQCDNCGERVYSQESTADIFKRIKSKASRKYIRVPVYA